MANKRIKTNINSGLSYNSFPGAGRRLRFRRLCMKSGLELI